MTKPVCLVIGAGAGIGGTVGARFAAGGYHAVLSRRTDAKGLDKLVSGIQAAGGKATGRLLNAVEPESIETLIAEVEQDIGPIDTLVFNLGAQIGNRGLPETSLKAFERCWRMSTFGLFRAAQAVCPPMAGRGSGTLLVTASTAAMRGNAGQHAHASAMAARRMLCQSLNAEFASQGVHVVHIIVDGTVDAPDTLGKMMGPERFAELRASKGPEDGLILPEQIAETYWHLANQHRSAWTHELDLRAWSDQAWWNHQTVGNLEEYRISSFLMSSGQRRDHGLGHSALCRRLARPCESISNNAAQTPPTRSTQAAAIRSSCTSRLML